MSRKRRRRIPRFIDLPLGYHIEVKYLSKEAFHEKNGSAEGAWWDESDGASEGGVIELIKEASPKDKWAGFLHELEHTLVDYREYLRSRV